MAVGDIHYRITNTGGNYAEVGFPWDPDSLVLPAIYGNGTLATYNFDVEFFANTSDIDTESGANTVYANTACYDLSIDSDPLTITTIKQSGNAIRITHLPFFELFPSEDYEFIDIDFDAGSFETIEKSILTARVFEPNANTAILAWNAPNETDIVKEFDFSISIIKASGDTPISYTYNQDVHWSSQEGLVLFSELLGD